MRLASGEATDSDILCIARKASGQKLRRELKLSASEQSFLRDVVRALRGDLESMARVGNSLVYDNKRTLCSLLVSLVTANISSDQVTGSLLKSKERFHR